MSFSPQWSREQWELRLLPPLRLSKSILGNIKSRTPKDRILIAPAGVKTVIREAAVCNLQKDDCASVRKVLQTSWVSCVRWLTQGVHGVGRDFMNLVTLGYRVRPSLSPSLQTKQSKQQSKRLSSESLLTVWQEPGVGAPSANVWSSAAAGRFLLVSLSQLLLHRYARSQSAHAHI